MGRYRMAEYRLVDTEWPNIDWSIQDARQKFADAEALLRAEIERRDRTISELQVSTCVQTYAQTCVLA